MNAIERRLNDAPPPPQGTPLRACGLCRCAYLDYPDGRDAHYVVFRHQPSDLAPPPADFRELVQKAKEAES